MQGRFLAFFIVVILFSGCGNSKEGLEQAYIEGYRVGWAHAADNRAAQLGETHDMRYVGIGKECLYDDPYSVQRQLHIFKDGRCPK